MCPDRSAAPEFDIIIVGAGSAGCTLAYRLTEDPATRVLVLEAGPPDRDPFIRMPRGFGRTLANRGLAWYYPTEADPSSGAQSELWLRGKTLGGSSAINGMVYMRGHPQDYDDWVAMGNPGWGWEVMGPIFERLEGGGGASGRPRLETSVHPDPDPLCNAFISAGEQLGLAAVTGLDGSEREGIGYVRRTISAGRRVSAATALLDPVRGRGNLQILTGTTALRVLFDGHRAIGVEGTRAGELLQYRARGEVMLCAGALNSPRILQLSGIGSAALLRALGIEVIVDSPHVGRHLREHRLLLMQYRVKTRHSQNRSLGGAALYANALRYFLSRRGVLSHGAYHVGALIRTRPELSRPDAQILMAPYSIDRGAKKLVCERHPGLGLFGYPLRPESEGSVMIRSRNPDVTPCIRTNWLQAAYDREVTLQMHRFMERLLAQSALRPYLGERTYPQGVGDSDEEILRAFVGKGQAGYHATGTCRMGPADDVVDARLRVRGVEGLRVVDLSVMPTMVSGNTNGPAMALGWRAADLVIEDTKAAIRA